MNNITIPWPDWKIVRRIGHGGFGTVYEISRRDQFGHEEHSALKVITLPQEADEIDQLRMEGYDITDITNRYKDQLKKIVEEYTLQVQMKGNSHIVSVEDRKAIPHADGPGWDLYIRMELLTPMREILRGQKDFTEEEIIRIGCDICQALVLCQKKNIIHRDIKPDNIFKSAAGDWKLGDFGIARTMEHSTAASKAGTFSYMAPEVFHGEKYGKEVDIYSLGMILYWLLNNRRRPFLPVDRPPTAAEEEQARIRRFSEGAEFPPPLNGSAELKRIVLKACSYHPKDRFSSAEEMFKELNALMTEAGIPEHENEGKINAEAERTEHVFYMDIENASEGSFQGGSSSISRARNEEGHFHGASQAGEKPGEDGWDIDVSVGDPDRFKGDNREPADIIEKTEKSEKAGNYSGKQTVSGGKKGPGALVISGAAACLILLLVAAFFLFGRKNDSSDTGANTQTVTSGKELTDEAIEELSFCEDFYYKYRNEFMDSMDQLNVDYVNDSISDIAVKLQDAGWQFMPSFEDDWSKMTPNIPETEDMKWYEDSNELYLRAVYPLSDDKTPENWCEINITLFPAGEYFRERRYVTFIGGANRHNAPCFRHNNQELWEQEANKWSANAPGIQKKALSGFLPTEFIELLSTGSWEEAGLTIDQFRILQEATKNYGEHTSETYTLTWEKDGWRFHSWSMDDYESPKVLRIGINYNGITIEHDDNSVIVESDSDKCIGTIGFYFEN